MPVNELEVTIKSSETYQHNFNILGDEEAASIKIQAEHYETSELIRDSIWDLIYYYQPKMDYSGRDYVEIEICEYRPRRTCEKNKIIKFYFTITD